MGPDTVVVMTDTEQPVDGRVARRQRNIDAVLDVVIEMFGEEALFPTMEQVANRSGLSLRSLYRYFADPAELLEAAIDRNLALGGEIIALPPPDGRSFETRLADFVDARVRLFEEFGAVARAARANALHHQRVRDQQADGTRDLRMQFETQFRAELDRRKRAERDSALAAGDALTQLQSIDYLRRQRQLSAAETRAVLVASLRSLLA